MATRYRPNRQDSRQIRTDHAGRNFAPPPNAMKASPLTVTFALLVAALHGQQPQAPARPNPDDQGVRFKSGVELINVTATVSDANGRFVPGLRQDDFLVYEDDQPVTVTHFSAERVPVSLGIALDTSGSMAGNKIQEAQSGARSLPLRPARSAGRDLPLPLQQPPGAAAGVDQGSPAAVARARPRRAERRHRDVRRRRRGDSADAAGAEPEEGAARDLGRQRHRERDDDPRAARRRFARPKCWSTRSASTASGEPTSRAAAAAARADAGAVAAAVPRRAAAGRRHAADLSAAAADRRRWRRRRYRRGGRTTTASTSWRCAT